jgi:hypothetical protein
MGGAPPHVREVKGLGEVALVKRQSVTVKSRQVQVQVQVQVELEVKASQL